MCLQTGSGGSGKQGDILRRRRKPFLRDKSGTSMSTPLISGAAALMLEKNPQLTNVEIKMMLKESADDMGLPRNQQGWGKFNLRKFMKL